MTSSIHSPFISIPLQAIPIAAAVLDGRGVIVAANRLFNRVFERIESTCTQRRLSELLSRPGKAAVEDALERMGVLEEGLQRCTIRALRAAPPTVWLAFDFARLGPGAAGSYFVCAHAMSGRRRVDSPPHWTAERGDDDAQDATVLSASLVADTTPWPPLLMTR
jgi:hypothetical protein